MSGHAMDHIASCYIAGTLSAGSSAKQRAKTRRPHHNGVVWQNDAVFVVKEEKSTYSTDNS